jgi:hypothetical protein
MQERTAFRLAMLRNGFQPLLNDCKRPIEKGWPRKLVDEAEVLAWDRSALLSTGLRIDGDLAVIDVDVAEASLVAALADALDKRFPALFRDGFVRHAGGVKEAWIARVEAPFMRLASRRWYRGDDPAVPKHMVECFGSLGTRQFGVAGPHARNKAGEIVSIYQFTSGASPATVPRTALPVLPKAAFAAACDLFERIARDAGLSVIERTGSDGGKDQHVVYDLTDAMVFESESAAYRGLTELTDACLAAAHEGRDLRVTSSFLGHGTNATKCIVGYSKGGRYVFVHDFETELTHKPANRARPDMHKFFELLREGSSR